MTNERRLMIRSGKGLFLVAILMTVTVGCAPQAADQSAELAALIDTGRTRSTPAMLRA